VLSGRGLCDELITRPEESYRLWCVVCDLETSRIGAPYIYDISNLRVNTGSLVWELCLSSMTEFFVSLLQFNISGLSFVACLSGDLRSVGLVRFFFYFSVSHFLCPSFWCINMAFEVH